jgi:alpha-1,3-glucan synthase
MLSQLTKTIKMALKSTEEERAVLRARSAVQRFPVVEWRQRTEDFHKRAITVSRQVAGPDAWRESDCDGGGPVVMAEAEDWNPIHQAYPSQPDWDSRSRSSMVDSPQIQTPGTPGQWNQETPPVDGAHATPRLLHPEGSGDDYFSRASHAPSEASQGGYDDFLERANRTIARDQRHMPDPFLDPSNAGPSRPFGAHSRVSSVESIASIVDEKSNSPLNKAIASVSLSFDSQIEHV